jgi:hypothetical protein
MKRISRAGAIPLQPAHPQFSHLIHIAANVAETSRIPIAIKSELGLLSGQNVPWRVQ